MFQDSPNVVRQSIFRMSQNLKYLCSEDFNNIQDYFFLLLDRYTNSKLKNVFLSLLINSTMVLHIFRKVIFKKICLVHSSSSVKTGQMKISVIFPSISLVIWVSVVVSTHES